MTCLDSRVNYCVNTILRSVAYTQFASHGNGSCLLNVRGLSPSSRVSPPRTPYLRSQNSAVFIRPRLPTSVWASQQSCFTRIADQFLAVEILRPLPEQESSHSRLAGRASFFRIPNPPHDPGVCGPHAWMVVRRLIGAVRREQKQI